MKRHHIAYLKEMVERIVSAGGEKPFEGRFYETSLPIMRLERKVPSCFVQYTPTMNELLIDDNSKPKDLKRVDVVEWNGRKYIRNLVKLSKQTFRYVLNFLVEDPGLDVLSDNTKPGILDQCIEYVSGRRKCVYVVPSKPGSATESINPDGIEFYAMVNIGQSNLETDYIEEKIYVIWLELIFDDGVYLIDEVPALQGATLEVVPPVQVVKE